jgi:hypothetical protein
LHDDIDVLRRTWPARFQAVFGAEIEPVAPRILVGSVRGDALTRTRERLGREIGSLKSSTPVPPEGILVSVS